MTLPLLIRGREKRARAADIKFRNPLPQPARIAVLDQRATGKNLRVFEPAQDEALQQFQPAVLAGTLDSLRKLATPPSGLKTVVIFSSSPLTAPDRDWLWEQFQVPCFEQLLGSHGRVIAEECEGHCGLHVVDVVPPTVMVTSAECGCGRTEPRLVT